ncbi:hypothetical protein BH09BAC2_BH09BAC2_01330 [soil metagenome]
MGSFIGLHLNFNQLSFFPCGAFDFTQLRADTGGAFAVFVMGNDPFIFKKK